MVCATVFCVVALAGPGTGIAPEPPWFTLADEPGISTGNVVQVRPEPISMDDRVMLQLRVSRDTLRTSFRGQKYRSYDAQVVINCNSRKAWYLWLSYYAEPRWSGPAVGREDYTEGQAPVLFRGMPGEPYKRMISAACKVAT